MSKLLSIEPLYGKSKKTYSKSDQYFSIPTSLSSSQKELYPICRTISEEAFSFEALGTVIKIGDKLSIIKSSPSSNLKESSSATNKVQSNKITKKIPSAQTPEIAKSLPLNKSFDPDSGRTLFINRSFEDPRNNEQDVSSKLPLFALHSTRNQNLDDPTTELTGELSATEDISFAE